MASKELTITEKWKIDAESYNNPNAIKTKKPQCEKCSYYIKGNALHCKKYIEESKPKNVMFAERECPYYKDIDPLNVQAKSESESRILGGVFGHAVGDMLGVPLEFTDRVDRERDPVGELRAYGTYHQPFGAWSDDTSLMLCLLDALCNDDVYGSLCRNMIAFHDKGSFTPYGVMFDIGISTKRAIEKMKNGTDPEKCGGRDFSDNGNGSLMRILPLAFILTLSDKENMIEEVSKISSFTHGHDISRFACLFYVVFASLLFGGAGFEEAYGKTVDEIGRVWNEDIPSPFSKLMTGKINSLPVEGINSTPYVVDSLEAAIWCLFNSSTYKDTVLSAVNLGGDTDTIAAIAGGLAGIYYGFEKIPDRWIQTVMRKELIYSSTQEFMTHYKFN